MEKKMIYVLIFGMVVSVVHGQACSNFNQCGCAQNLNCGCGCGGGQNQNSPNCGGFQNQNCPGCGCGQNPNQAMRNQFGQPMSPACMGPIPCYNVVLNFIADGPASVLPVNAESEFLQAWAQHGRMRLDAIAEGRKAVQFFNQRFGIDFTSIGDGELLRGERRNENGIEFKPYLTASSQRFRLYTASTTSEAQLVNMPIIEQGWLLNYTRAQWASGTFRKLVPAGTIAIYGNFIFRPCGMPDMSNSRDCRNILNPQDPWAATFLTFKSPTYLVSSQEPYAFTAVDCIFEHTMWGEGRGRGIAVRRDVDPGSQEIYDWRMTVSFPSFR